MTIDNQYRFDVGSDPDRDNAWTIGPQIVGNAREHNHLMSGGGKSDWNTFSAVFVFCLHSLVNDQILRPLSVVPPHCARYRARNAAVRFGMTVLGG